MNQTTINPRTPSNGAARRSPVMLTLILGLVWGAFTCVSAQTPVTACGTEINVPGSYILTGNLDCGGFFGVLINSRDVVLDLNGFAISPGPEQTLAAGVFVACHPVVSVQNGKISGATNGVILNCDVPTPGGILLKDLTLSQNRTAIAIFRSSSNTVKNTIITGSQIGILLSNSHSNTIRSNMITGNSRAGIQVESGSLNNTIKSNVLNGNDSGILLIDGDNSVIDSNTANDNVSRGIWLTINSTNNIVKKNTATGNGNFDLFDEGLCASNVWDKNTFTTANNVCIN